MAITKRRLVTAPLPQGHHQRNRRALCGSVRTTIYKHTSLPRSVVLRELIREHQKCIRALEATLKMESLTGGMGDMKIGEESDSDGEKADGEEYDVEMEK